MIRVHSFNEHPGRRIRHREIQKTATTVVRSEGRRDALVRVIFTSDARMRKLNTRWLGHRTTTDVLSFPFEDDRSNSLEGEVYVNLDQARRQAEGESVSDRNEISRLVIHGVLHLLGYEDGTRAEKKAMSAKEDEYLRLLSLH